MDYEKHPDMTASDGKGDWIFDKQIDYATN